MANVPTPHIKAKMGEIAEKILKKRKIKNQRDPETTQEICSASLAITKAQR